MCYITYFFVIKHKFCNMIVISVLFSFGFDVILHVLHNMSYITLEYLFYTIIYMRCITQLQNMLQNLFTTITVMQLTLSCLLGAYLIYGYMYVCVYIYILIYYSIRLHIKKLKNLSVYSACHSICPSQVAVCAFHIPVSAVFSTQIQNVLTLLKELQLQRN